MERQRATDFDLFVIGAGSGGIRAARMAAVRGNRVAVAESARLGGTCVNVGCVPKKLLVYASQFADAFDDAAGFGWRPSRPPFCWPDLIAAKNAEIERLNSVYRRLLEDAGVTVVDGRARLVDRHTIAVGDRRFAAESVLIATGGRPDVPDVPGAELGVVSDELFTLPDLPERIAIVGGGYIAVEFAGIFRGLGSRVSLTYRGPVFLRGFDRDVRAAVADEMTERGIELHFDQEVIGLDRTGAGALRVLGPEGEVARADMVLWATGRVPNTAGLGLEKIGVELGSLGQVLVDEHSETSVPGIYAVGDCTDRVALTPVALAEAMAVVETLNGRPTAVDYGGVPTAVFSQPPVAAVGLTEEGARAAGCRLRVYRSAFRPLVHTLSGRNQRSMMKLVVDADTDRVLGIHMVGDDAPEIIQGFAVAMRCGATKAQLDATLGVHPTAAEELVTMRDPIDNSSQF